MRLLLALLVLFAAAPAVAEPIVAVLAFDVDSHDPAHAPLGRGLANMLITDLDRAGGVSVVERTRLNALLKELQLQQSDFVDPATAARVGEGIGATEVLIGGITATGGDMRIDARLVRVSTGEVGITASSEGHADQFFKLEEKLVRDLSKELRAQVSARNEAQFALRSEIPLQGAVSYSTAVTEYDSGERDIGRHITDAAALSGKQQKVSRIFEADIKPIPPIFAALGLAAGPTLGVLPGAKLGTGLSVQVQGGYGPSEVGAIFGLVSIPLSGPSVTRTPTSETGELVNEVRLVSVHGGARLRVTQYQGHGVHLVGSGGLTPGSQRLMTEYELYQVRRFIGLGARGGLEMVFMDKERVGLLAGVHAGVDLFSLGKDHGMLGTGTRVAPAIEVRVGYVTFGGER